MMVCRAGKPKQLGDRLSRQLVRDPRRPRHADAAANTGRAFRAGAAGPRLGRAAHGGDAQLPLRGGAVSGRRDGRRRADSGHARHWRGVHHGRSHRWVLCRQPAAGRPQTRERGAST